MLNASPTTDANPLAAAVVYHIKHPCQQVRPQLPALAMPQPLLQQRSHQHNCPLAPQRTSYCRSGCRPERAAACCAQRRATAPSAAHQSRRRARHAPHRLPHRRLLPLLRLLHHCWLIALCCRLAAAAAAVAAGPEGREARLLRSAPQPGRAQQPAPTNTTKARKHEDLSLIANFTQLHAPRYTSSKLQNDMQARQQAHQCKQATGAPTHENCLPLPPPSLSRHRHHTKLLFQTAHTQTRYELSPQPPASPTTGTRPGPCHQRGRTPRASQSARCTAAPGPGPAGCQAVQRKRDIG